MTLQICNSYRTARRYNSAIATGLQDVTNLR